MVLFYQVHLKFYSNFVLIQIVTFLFDFPYYAPLTKARGKTLCKTAAFCINHW